MPSAWSNRRERQYEHIKDSEKQRGRSTRRAKEIAARTVNKSRRQHGETKAQQRSRSSNSEPTKQDLYDKAKRLDIEGRSKMNKDELAKAVRKKS